MDVETRKTKKLHIKYSKQKLVNGFQCQYFVVPHDFDANKDATCWKLLPTLNKNAHFERKSQGEERFGGGKKKKRSLSCCCSGRLFWQISEQEPQHVFRLFPSSLGSCSTRFGVFHFFGFLNLWVKEEYTHIHTQTNVWKMLCFLNDRQVFFFFFLFKGFIHNSCHAKTETGSSKVNFIKWRKQANFSSWLFASDHVS